MSIGDMDGVPKVEPFKEKVAVWAKADDGEDIGFLLRPAAAVEVATRLLKVSKDLADDRVIGHDIEAIGFQVGHTPGESTGRLVLVINGAELTGFLTETQIAELTAAFNEASKAIAARGDGPRKNV